MVPFQVLNGHSSTVWNVAFDSNSQQLYSCGDDGSVVIWSRDPSTQRFSLLITLTEIHNLPVYGIALVKADLFVTVIDVERSAGATTRWHWSGRDERWTAGCTKER